MKNKDRHATQRWERSQERQRVRNEDAYAAMASENSRIDLELDRFLREENERQRQQSLNGVMDMNVLKAILLSKKRRGELKGVKKVIVIP
jgi:hypothetical protein